MNDLEAYGEATVTSMLYLALEACGVRDEQADHAACHIGQAAAVTTAIRALAVHARLGQRYIPDEVMKKHGLRDRELLSRGPVASSSSRVEAGVTSAKDGSRRLTAGAQLDAEAVALERQNLRKVAGERLAAAAAAAASRSASAAPSLPSPQLTLAHTEQPCNAAATATSGASSTSASFSSSAGHSRIIRVGESTAAQRALNRDSGGFTGQSRSVASSSNRSSFSSPTIATAGEGTAATNFSRSPPPAAENDSAAAAVAPVAKLPAAAAFSVDAETAPKLQEAVFELACVARSHIEHARQLRRDVPYAATAALLPAVPIWRFLDRLEAQGFDIVQASAQSGSWSDGRPLARVYLQLDLLRHALKGTY